MSGLEVVDLEGGKQVLRDVRSDKVDKDWCLFSYEGPKSSKIVLVGSGNGGIEELKTHLKNDIVGYGLVRKTDKIDESITVKFCFINWLGDDVPRMQKARISTQTGAIKDFIGQYHVDISCSNLNEITDQIIQEKIMDTSGSGSRVMDSATGSSQLRSQSGTAQTRERSLTGSKTSGQLEFKDEQGFKEKIRAVRSGPNDWILFGYEGDSSVIIQLGEGEGGVSELVTHLNDNIVGYGLVRKVEQIDDTQATKFAFIKFQGDNIPRMLKARIGTHSGKIIEFLSPYHVTLDVTRTNELSEEIVLNTIKTASGTKVHVLEGEKQQNRPAQTSISKGSSGPAVAKPLTNSSIKLPAVPKSNVQEQTIKFKDEEGLKADIKDVRNDGTETNWVLVGYEGKKGNVLEVLGKGSGGVDELVAKLEDDMVGYGLVRKTERIDESLTVKFIHIVFLGENINRMHRARLGTHKGAINSLFSPYHTDFEATEKKDLTDEALTKRISDASGTANKVKN